MYANYTNEELRRVLATNPKDAEALVEAADRFRSGRVDESALDEAYESGYKDGERDTQFDYESAFEEGRKEGYEEGYAEGEREDDSR